MDKESLANEIKVLNFEIYEKEECSKTYTFVLSQLEGSEAYNSHAAEYIKNEKAEINKEIEELKNKLNKLKEEKLKQEKKEIFLEKFKNVEVGYLIKVWDNDEDKPIEQRFLGVMNGNVWCSDSIYRMNVGKAWNYAILPEEYKETI